MNDIAIRVENLGKQYRIGGPSTAPLDVARDKLRTGKQERYRTPSPKLLRAGLRDTLTDAFVSPFRRAGKLLRGQAYGAAEKVNRKSTQ